MIVGFSGYAGAGKDAAADYLVEHYYFRKRGYADRLRGLMRATNPQVLWGTTWIPWNEVVDTIGYTRAKQETDGRAVMQRLGNGVRDVLGYDTWVEAAFNDFDYMADYAFIDVRFPNEARAIKERGGEVWRIHRPGVGPANEHISEVALDDWPFDFTIDNSGAICDLERTLDSAMETAAAKLLMNPNSRLQRMMVENDYKLVGE